MNPRLILLVVFLLIASWEALAATITWTNTAGGNWNVAANWNPNSVPGAADTAVITNSGTYNVTLNVAATLAGFTLGGTSGTQTVALSSSTLTLNGPGTVNANGVFNLSGGTLTGTGDLTANGPFNWSGGSLSGASRVFANGGLTLSGGGTKFLTGRTLVNAGAATWTAGGISLGGGGALSNAATGTFDCVFDGSITTGGGSGWVVANAGLFRKTAGAGTTTIGGGILFNNVGTAEVQSGTLTLNGGGTNSGDFIIASGATNNLGGGTHLFTEGNITGTGLFSVSAGTANFAGTLGITTVFIVSGGTANFNGNDTITLAQLDVSGGTLGGSNNLVITGAMNWTGGSISGTNKVTANGGLTVSGAGTKFLTGRTLVNAGAATWTAGAISLAGGGALSNAATGTFDCAFDGNITGGGGIGWVVANSGLFRKTAGIGTTTVNGAIVFNNTGTVEVQSGTLNLNGGGTDTGNFTIANDTTLNLGGGTHNLTDVNITGTGTFAVSAGTANFSGTLSGDGTLNVSGGSAIFNVSGAIAIAQLVVSSGTLGGDNNFTVGGAMIWSGGTIGGSGNVIASGGLTLSGDSAKFLTGRTLVNAGAATWSGGTISMSSGGVLSNAASGTFDCASDVAISPGVGGGAVANAGFFRKTTGAGATTISSPIAFNNTGTVEVQSGSLTFGGTYIQTAGLTLLNGGSFTISGSPVQIRGGVLAGNGLITGSVSNNAVLSPGTSPGRLIVNGAYTQTTNGAMNIELAGTAPGVTFDQLIVSNALTLAGALNVTLTNGFYPAPDFTFTNVVRAASRTGTFAAFSFPSNAVGLQVNYGTTNVDLEVINTLPVLPMIGTQTLDELTLLSFNVNASDADAPAQTLSYALANSPADASINSSGLLTWTPTEAQGPLTTNLTVLVTDNGTPSLTSTQTIQAVAREINVAPVLILPPNASFAELTIYSNNATATDSDVPVNGHTFALVSGPPGLTVSSAGAITWTPTEAQGSNSYPVTVRVTDNNPDAFNEQQLSTTNSFVLTVREVNLPPNLTVPANQILTEQTALSVSASATDSDVPANGLSFALVSPPAGMLINSGNGDISWTPDETQGSNTYTINVVVTDDNPLAVNATHLSVTNSFTVMVNESNRPPVLTVPGNLTLTEENPLTGVSASATDPDVPANPLTYALLSPPSGMTINAGSGAISWTPTEAQGSNSYTITVTVADTNATVINPKQFIVTNTFLITVNESNRAPVLNLPANQTINELAFYTNNATATDPDLPANALTFALVSGPTNLAVSSAGAITWTPSEIQGPSTNPVSIKVTDNGSPPLSVTNAYTLIVSEVNVAPVLAGISGRTVNPGAVIVFTNTATDADLPTNTLVFSLLSPPPGAGLAGSVFTWRPSVSQANTTNVIQVKVADNGSPSLSATQSFTVIVNPLTPVVLTPVEYTNGQFILSVTGLVGPDYILQGSDTLADWTNLATNTPGVMPFNFTHFGAGAFSNHFYRMQLRP